MVRVRIAPSPTGFAHVGTAYIALFNYAFAKKQNGKFILRLEDTDQKREVEGAEKAIYSGLSWLGLTWDEGPDIGGDYGPYRQSERLELYRKKADELVEKGLAYKDEGAIRFKNPGEDVGWQDMVRGEVNFPGGEVTDFVIVKSDGFPTYNFGVVIDDIEMHISHVIRGEEHISNTPRQIALYRAFGVETPLFGHLPTLRNADRKKLSKRRDPVDLRLYREQGYLPQALLNFLCLLGWSHPEEKEIFGLQEFVKVFDPKRIRKAGPFFDTKKLDWINGHYIRELSNAEFVKIAVGFLEVEEQEMRKIIPLVKDRISKFAELKDLAGFFFDEPEVDESLFGESYKKHLTKAFEVIEKLDDWNLERLNENLMKVVTDSGFKTGDFFMDLRIALTGRKFTPPINDSIIILGKEETLKRLKKVL